MQSNILLPFLEYVPEVATMARSAVGTALRAVREVCERGKPVQSGRLLRTARSAVPTRLRRSLALLRYQPCFDAVGSGGTDRDRGDLAGLHAADGGVGFGGDCDAE